MRTTWPFTGRTSTLDEVGSLLRTGDAHGVVVAGAAGVGKTRLVREALNRLEPERFKVLRVGCTAADTGIPFGAFGHVLPVEGAVSSVANPLRWASEALRSVAGDGTAPLLVAVDDAHLLDPNSAALVHHLVLHRQARVLATVRTGAAAPDPVTALWKDDLARRLDLVALSKAESQAVVEAALGGQLAEPTARRLHHSSQGNLLFLRELVLAGLAAGRLTEIRGVWRWEGDLPLSPRLMELIGARLEAARPDEREVLEYVALGEPLGAAKLVALTSEEAVERAEARNLVASCAAGRRLEVRTAHPLYGEVARVRAGPERVRERLADLAGALERTGMRRHGDVLRVATWHLDSGTPAGPGLLLAACLQAWTLHDMDLAVRCGRAALAAGADAAATIRIAPVLMLAGRAEEAEGHLAGIADEPMDETLRVRLATARALVLGLGMGRTERAERLLDETAARTSDPALHAELLAQQATGMLYGGRFGEARRKIAEARAESPQPRVRAQTDAMDALAAALTGRFDRAVEVATAGLGGQDRWIEEAPNLVVAFSDARSAAAVFAGDLGPADAFIAYSEERFAKERLLHVGAATSRYLRAYHSLLRGNVRAAVRWAHEAAAYGSAVPPALSGHGHEILAYAAAQAGDLDAASAALTQAEGRRIPSGRIFHFPGDLGRAWLRACQGDTAGAAALALGSAADQLERELRSFALFSLHDAVRLGAADQARDGLRRLADEMDGPLPVLCARHAAAAADQDGEALDEVSRAFEGRGLTLYAAEAAAQASRAHAANGAANRQANAAATRARALALACPGARTPVLSGLAAPELTSRQLEIARLAADGLGNREIADRLVLSVRTVANHLQAVYDRLGVRDRESLRDVVG